MRGHAEAALRVCAQRVEDLAEEPEPELIVLIEREQGLAVLLHYASP
ncbi:hypothetical protein ACGH7X_21250 [Streptomyces sp. BBFR51]